MWLGINQEAILNTTGLHPNKLIGNSKDHGKNGDILATCKQNRRHEATERLFCVQEILLIYGTFFRAFDFFKLAETLFAII